MEIYTARTTGSYIENKRYAVLWRFADADPDYGDMQAREMLDHLNNVLSNFPVFVIRGKQYVEVRPDGVDKGTVAKRVFKWADPLHHDILNHQTSERLAQTSDHRPANANTHPVDFVLCLGDDVADEAMFAAVGDIYMPKVGSKNDDGSKLAPRLGSGGRQQVEQPGSNVVGRRPHVFTATVGIKASNANYYVDSPTTVVELLERLASVSRMASSQQRSLSLTDLASLAYTDSTALGFGTMAKPAIEELLRNQKPVTSTRNTNLSMKSAATQKARLLSSTSLLNMAKLAQQGALNEAAAKEAARSMRPMQVSSMSEYFDQFDDDDDEEAMFF